MANVLVVEDDVCTQQLYAATLRRHGFECTLVGDGEAALAELRRHEFSAVILDLLLPKVNGFDVLRELKCVAPAVLPRVVVCSVMRQAKLGDCLELEFIHAYLEKPMDVEELAAAVRTAAGLAVPERKPPRSVTRGPGQVVPFRHVG